MPNQTPHSDLSPGTNALLSRGILRNFICGEWKNVPGAALIDVVDPSCGEALVQLPLSSAADVDAAVDAASHAFPAWAQLSQQERSAALIRLADELEGHKDELAEIEALDVGKALVNAEAFDIPFGIECLRYYATLALSVERDVPLSLPGLHARVRRAPYGVCGYILPWNFPFDLLMWGIVPALAAGNTVVVKPSEITPLSTLYLCEASIRAGIPPGVINVVLGDGPGVGAALSNHSGVRRMAFTGSTSVGRTIAQACANNLIPCKLELGGKGAAVVTSDIDVSRVSEKLAGAITLNTGQVCCTATRWIVHEDIFDDFVAATVSHLTKIRIGTSLSRHTEMGPLASRNHHARVANYIARSMQEGATQLLSDSNRSNTEMSGGFYCQPTLLTGSLDNVCWKEEVFGPVAFVARFRTDTEAISLVNSSRYGLANSVWCRDEARANAIAEKMIAGNSWINAHNVFAYGLPYGGVNLSGIGGGVNGPDAYSDYLRNQTIAEPL